MSLKKLNVNFHPNVVVGVGLAVNKLLIKI